MNHVILFQPRFAPLVRSGAKLQTIRPKRKREIKPGDTLSLREWAGKPYRSKQRVLAGAACISSQRIIIKETGVQIEMGIADQFGLAKSDGFDDFGEMLNWFAETHGLPFSGILIKWRLK